ncbi:S1C family serine protease [Brachybacterium sacelli]|uniref:Serine protease PepD n=1 Tax=Brachybacterium sacelli TaxID=173364 RepID=A0ABS4X3X4_9MICO|nr:trypsin-like peptidase domain-containing protein [Brachybacterium sacelli]MBP2383155.1 putative serine protease PepD [Brachybacterium sacelli]
MADMKDFSDPYETPQDRPPRPPEQGLPHFGYGDPTPGGPNGPAATPTSAGPADTADTPPTEQLDPPLATGRSDGYGSAGGSGRYGTAGGADGYGATGGYGGPGRSDGYGGFGGPGGTAGAYGVGSGAPDSGPTTPAGDPWSAGPADPVASPDSDRSAGAAAPWTFPTEDRDTAAFPSTYADPYGGGTQTASSSSTAATSRRRGPGWGGVTGLIALGMLVSSGLTLGGVVAYDQLLTPEPTSTAQQAPETSADASPASVSTVDDPDWASVAEQVSPSAVAIQVSTGAGTSQGTGVVLDGDGSILTNNHVVEGARSVQVTMSDGLSYSASIVGTDADTDLAVIRLDSPPEDLQPATFADSATVAVGQPVMALGTPLGLENTVTTGIVSALDRPVTATGGDPSGSDSTYTSAIQTDAAINPGNSGGPLVDAAGQVIGINSSIAGIPNPSGQAGSIGLGFAIPANTATMIAEQLQEDGTADHSFLGVTSTDGTVTLGNVAHHGAEVVSVEPGSPAEEAGLRKGDLITAIDETDVGGAAALTGIVRGMAVGTDHTLSVVRGQDEQSLDITLASSPS